jgi:hypothetical protein
MSVPKPRIHLLSEADLSCIAQQGAPVELRPELIQLSDCGKVIFTMRGIQFYKHATEQYGVDAKLGAIRTEADVLRLHVDLGAAAFSHLVSRLDKDGLVSEQAWAQVQSLIKGSLEAIAHAANRLRAHVDAASASSV